MSSQDLEKRNLEDLNTILKEAEELGQPLIKPEQLNSSEESSNNTPSDTSESNKPTESAQNNEIPEGMVKVTVKGKEIIVKDEPFLQEAINAGNYDPTYTGKNKKTAEQFVKDGSYFKKIAEQRRTIEELKQDVGSVKELLQKQIDHANKLAKIAAGNKLKELQDRKSQSILEGDVEAVEAIEEEQAKIAAEIPKEEKVVENIPPASETLKSWVKDNADWCNTETPENIKMAQMADATAQFLAVNNPELSEKEILEKTTLHIKLEFPHRFQDEDEDNVAPVDSGSGTGGSGRISRLTDEQYSLFQQAKEVGCTITLEDYEKQLELLGELKDE